MTLSATSTLDGPRVAPAVGGAASALVILLHGYWSNGEDLIGLVPYWRDALPGTAFVAPNAPEVCPGAPGGYQWWAITSLDRSARAAGAARAAPVLDAFIDAELARHDLTEASLALVGFSQGTMMALTVGPRRRRALAGIVGYSGMLADPAGLAGEGLTRPPVLLVHGDADPMIPLAAFHEARDTLTANGFAVEAHVSRGLGHSIDPDGLRLGRVFLSRVLGG
jgi:phospholipase/carboxylesterase